MFIALRDTPRLRSYGAPCFFVTRGYKHIAPPEQSMKHIAPPEQSMNTYCSSGAKYECKELGTKAQRLSSSCD
jgi:hypothetical protein